MSEKENQGSVGVKVATEVGNRIAVLTLVSGELIGGKRTFRLHKERIVLGSVESADVSLKGPGIAPIHAVIELSDPATIFDLASVAGTSVNGEKIVTRALKIGDRIKIGTYEFKFETQALEKAASESKPPQVLGSGRRLFQDPEEDTRPLLLVEASEVEDIFDYRPSERPALEVVMSWNGMILDIEHFSTQKNVWIGSDRSSDFGIPDLLGARKFAFATRMGDEYSIQLDAKMSGILHRQRQLTEVRNSSQSISFSKGDYAKLSIGEVDFYLSYTPAPPALKNKRLFERDPFWLRIMSTSLVFSLLALFGISKMQVNPQIEAEELPKRIVTILYQPEKFARVKPYEPPKPKAEVPKEKPAEPKKEPPKPKPPEPKKETLKVEIKPKPVDLKKPIPKELEIKKAQNIPKKVEGQNKSKEGEGARAKGKEGVRGSPHAAKGKDHQQKALRPSPHGGTGRGGSNSQVGKEGNVELMAGTSDKIQNILGSATAKLGSGGSKLQGYGGFDTEGNGGLALSGSGKGGGGKVESLGGLGDKGLGGGRVGTGLGAVGDGSGIVGGRSRIIPRRGGAEEAVVVGSIDTDAIERAIMAHRDEFRLCYEREINAENPNLAGRVSTSFVIGASGRVTRAGIVSSTLKNANTERCVLDVLKRIDFPSPKGGTEVQVTYPFKFSPTGK